MVTKIKNLHRLELHNLEHYQFADRVLTLCKEANQEKLTAVLTPLQTAVAAEDKALNRPREQESTKPLEEADRKRDQSYQALKLIVSVHQHSADAVMLASAEAIARVLRAYPDVTTSNYDKETGLIRNLIADLKAPALAPHVAKTGLVVYITRLDADNTAFDKLFHSRVKAATPADGFDVKVLRAATDRALAAVLRRIEALDELEPSPQITALITQYNALVDNRRTMLAHRAGTSQTAREKKEEEKVRKQEEKAKKAEEKAKLTELKRAEETAKSQEDFKALLQPLFSEFEAAKGLPVGSLSFTGSFVGSGARRHYELAATSDGKISKLLWVSIGKNGKLKEVEAPKRK